jgi:hypothetical protein
MNVFRRRRRIDENGLDVIDSFAVCVVNLPLCFDFISCLDVTLCDFESPVIGASKEHKDERSILEIK